jgi:hypothetical protein
MNGDRKHTLMDNLHNAYDALRHAERMLCQCAPHGRNYYPVDGLLAQAIDQHKERMAHLRAILVSVETEAIEIDRAYPTRK